MPKFRIRQNLEVMVDIEVDADDDIAASTLVDKRMDAIYEIAQVNWFGTREIEGPYE